MSKALYCDRCGKLFQDCMGNYHVTVEFDKYNEPILDGDLCVDCQDDLEAFVFSKEEDKEKDSKEDSKENKK